MGLDYGYTCGEIDDSIKAFKEDVDTHLSDILEECSPMLEGLQKDNYIKDWVITISESFESAAEDVRSTNVDMRKDADSQIEDLDYKLMEANNEIADLNNRIGELESELQL